jgi:hypothetical protein
MLRPWTSGNPSAAANVAWKLSQAGDVNFGGGTCGSMNPLPAWDVSEMSDERASARCGDGEMCDVTDVARVLEVSEDQVREWIGSGIVQHTTLANGEHRVRIREESMGIPGDMERRFVLVSIGDVPPWVCEPTRAILPDLQSRDPIAKVVLDAKQEAVAPEAGIILGLAEAGLRGGRGGAIPRIPHRPTLFVSVAAFLQDAFLDMDSGCAQARPACPYHDHPVHPTLMNGDAWWTCPRREGALPGVGKPRGPESRLREPDLRTAGRTFVSLYARSNTGRFCWRSTWRYRRLVSMPKAQRTRCPNPKPLSISGQRSPSGGDPQVIPFFVREARVSSYRVAARSDAFRTGAPDDRRDTGGVSLEPPQQNGL